MNEMKHLSSECFVGNFPIIGLRRVYDVMLQVACNNLALNGILGYIEFFSSQYFCNVCFATQDDNQCKFCEDDFELRTPQEHTEDVAAL
jgi:recombinational DNA repair protein RecR